MVAVGNLDPRPEPALKIPSTLSNARETIDRRPCRCAALLRPVAIAKTLLKAGAAIKFRQHGCIGFINRRGRRQRQGQKPVTANECKIVGESTGCYRSGKLECIGWHGAAAINYQNIVAG